MKNPTRINPVYIVADFTHGAYNTVLRLEKKHHHYIVGAIFMCSGSGLAKAASAFHFPHLIDVGVDVVAYAVHGLGAMPFVEPIHAKFFGKSNNETTN